MPRVAPVDVNLSLTGKEMEWRDPEIQSRPQSSSICGMPRRISRQARRTPEYDP
ncbi:MAG: hypothetical protein N2385_01960 [Chloroflexus sp.]|nr:hypothetical protein [Chloroflexus sp.]